MKFFGIVAACIVACGTVGSAMAASTADLGTDLGQIRPPKATKGGQVCAGESRIMGNGDKDSAVNIKGNAACVPASVQLLSSDEAKSINADRVSQW